MDSKKESGRRLKEARIKAGFETLESLADQLGLDYKGRAYTVSKLSNYERGYRAIHPEIAKQVANTLGCSAGWLLCLDEHNTVLSNAEKALLDNFRASDQRGKSTISRVAEEERQYEIGDLDDTG